MRACVRPCRACPWKVDSGGATAIPGYDHDKAEALANTSRDERGFGPSYGAPMFACHESTEGNDLACAGWLAVEGDAHPSVRLAVLAGDIKPEALRPGEGWPALHGSFREVIEKLRSTRQE